MKKVPAIIEIVTYVESTIDKKCINRVWLKKNYTRVIYTKITDTNVG